MGVKVTTRAIREILDSEGKITGYELENVYSYEAEGPDDPMAKIAQPRVQFDEVTAEKVAELRGLSDNGLLTENKKLHEQIAGMQSVAEATAEAAAKQVAGLVEGQESLRNALTEVTSRHNALAARLGQINKLANLEE